GRGPGRLGVAGRDPGLAPNAGSFVARAGPLGALGSGRRPLGLEHQEGIDQLVLAHTVPAGDALLAGQLGGRFPGGRFQFVAGHATLLRCLSGPGTPKGDSSGYTWRRPCRLSLTRAGPGVPLPGELQARNTIGRIAQRHPEPTWREGGRIGWSD